MTDLLEVRFENAVVGWLRVAGTRFVFRYDDGWLASVAAFPISHSVPLAPGELTGDAAHWFFANLLPEGAMRTAVCRRLGISEANDVALLEAIGGECAGALRIVTPGSPAPDPDRYRYEELSRARLQAIVERQDLVPLLVGGPNTRLSLAGAQDKLPVALLDGRIHLPTGAAPSTHILKLPHARFRDIAINEAFVLGLAIRIGLPAIDADLVDTEPASLIVPRYDRIASDEHWPVVRRHQEDVCQAMGLPPSQKYEQEGGPSLPAVVELVGAISSAPLVDIARLLEWQAFNLVAGNADGHGKNLAFLFDGPRPQLAPFYDLLSTRQYADLTRQLAMSIGGERDPGHVRRAQWEAFARQSRLAPRVVLDAARGVAERTLETLPHWTDEFRGRYGRAPLLQRLPAWIAKSARRVLRDLRP